MSDQYEPPMIEDRLVFYWYEPKADEAPGEWWGQLMGGIHRLIDVRDLLNQASRRRDPRAGMHELQRGVELCLYRTFELRDRAYGLLGSKTGLQNQVNKLRHGNQRALALIQLKSVDPSLTEAVEALDDFIQHDKDARNIYTHERFLMLGMYVADSLFDPFDVLVDLASNPSERRRVEGWLRREIRKTCREYTDRIEKLVELAEQVASAGEPISE